MELVTVQETASPVHRLAERDEPDYRACLTENLPLVQRVVRAVCRRYRVRPDEQAEFLGSVFLKLVDNDYAVLRRFGGRSGLRTFLFAVVHRHLLDWRNSQWGKWRPSAQARRLGRPAVLLEELIVRDGFGVHEAVATVASQREFGLSAEALWRLHEQLPPRVRRRQAETCDALGLAAVERADVCVEHAYLQGEASRVRAALVTALGSLKRDDRRLLTLRFKYGCSLAEIARTTGSDQKALYRRFDRLLRRLRVHLESNDLRAANVHEILGHDAVELDSVLAQSSAEPMLTSH